MDVMASNFSCGVGTLRGFYSHGFANELDRNRAWVRQIARTRRAFYVFSHTSRNPVTLSFIDFLLENDLGEVYETDSKRNPNSGNQISVWIYQPNRTRLNAFVRELGRN